MKNNLVVGTRVQTAARVRTASREKIIPVEENGTDEPGVSREEARVIRRRRGDVPTVMYVERAATRGSSE